jgi:hypothetical protein
MEIVYCSKCHNQIPPGGLHEGRYFLVRDEPVCMECYEHLPENVREGSIQLFVPSDTRQRQRPTAKLPGYEGPSAQKRGHPRDDLHPEPSSLKVYAGWAVAVMVIVGVAAYFIARWLLEGTTSPN